MDINQNRPASVNPVSNEKNAVPRTFDTLTGHYAGSFNGGHDRTVACFPVMAGEKHKQFNMQMKVKLLTPITPPYMNCYLTLTAYYVPDIRVWSQAEEFYAQNKGSADVKITEVPHMGGKFIPALSDEEEMNYINMVNTTQWRDSWVSDYLPRIGTLSTSQVEDEVVYVLPNYSILPIRGRVAIYNDFLRQKEFSEKRPEYRDSSTVSDQEWDSYIPKIEDYDFYSGRSKRPDNYYTNYRTQVQGFEQAFPPEDMSSDRALITWASWEAKIAESRSEAENINLNPWQVIAKIRGSKIAKEGKVQLIGRNTIPLNYAAITQNAYNNNEEVREDFRVLGQQGAYSFTEINAPVYAGFQPNEEGHIHIIANVWVESVFESGFDRRWLNINALDQYRPDLKDDKFDVLYEIETSCSNPNTAEDPTGISYNQAIGFKRKYSEYFKLPNLIKGDLTSEGYFQTTKNAEYKREQLLYSQNSYQFYEKDRYFYEGLNGILVEKTPWLDYSDLLINKNQAILNVIENNDEGNIWLEGHNQIDYVGRGFLTADIPVDESIKNNFTKFGEH